MADENGREEKSDPLWLVPQESPDPPKWPVKQYPGMQHCRGRMEEDH